jgi:predicted AlkP superfamily pyrophosphatase or phosphodiesterase
MVEMIKASYHPQRSGDVMVYLAQYHLFGKNSIASHGTPHHYDRHVALAFLGGQIKPQIIEEEVAPVIIAPTLAERLGVSMPNTDGVAFPIR